MGIAPLGHRQGLLMAIADLAAYNSQTHGDSSPQHSRSTPARTRGRPQTAPNARGSSPARPRSDGSVSPDPGLKVLLLLFSVLPILVENPEQTQTQCGQGNVCDCCCCMVALTSVQALCGESQLFFLHGQSPAICLSLHSWCMLHCSGW